MSTPRVINPIPYHPVICPTCLGNHEYDAVGEHRLALFHSVTVHGCEEFNDQAEDFWHCEHCDWQQYTQVEDYDNTAPLSEDVAAMVSRLRRVENTYQSTAADLSDIDFPEDDFRWDDMEGGDWHVYCCGEKDCPRQWHMVCYAEKFERVNGVLTITRESCDEDGNWEFDDEWTATDGPFSESDMARSWNDGLRDYFKGWAEYWLDCARTLNDPLENAFDGPDDMVPEAWVKFCVSSACDNIQSLERMVKAQPADLAELGDCTCEPS